MEIRHLVLGMDAGIRPPRTAYFGGNASQLVKSALEACLNAGGIRLALPTAKVSSIISQD